MPYLGGKTSKLSIDLGNVRRALKSGKTRRKEPHDLTEAEITDLRMKGKSLEQKRDAIQSAMKGHAQTRKFGCAATNDLFVMRCSYNDRFIKIGSSPDVEAHRASLEDGRNFQVEVLATCGGQGHLAEGVRRLLEAKRSGQGACDHWFSASLGEASYGVVEHFGGFCVIARSP